MIWSSHLDLVLTCKLHTFWRKCASFNLFSLFKQGLSNFKVVLGDSHLGLDLQFGVQEHTILKALVHENYNINDNYHYNDIGLDFDLY